MPTKGLTQRLTEGFKKQASAFASDQAEALKHGFKATGTYMVAAGALAGAGDIDTASATIADFIANPYKEPEYRKEFMANTAGYAAKIKDTPGIVDLVAAGALAGAGDRDGAPGVVKNLIADKVFSAFDIAKEVVTSPRAVLNLATENLPNALPSLATGAAGAGAGAAYGSFFPGVGTAVGGVTGFYAGMGAGEIVTETGAKTVELIQDHAKEIGADPRDPVVVKRILESPGFKDKALKQGLIKGSVIAAVDMLTMWAGGKVLTGPARQANKEIGEAITNAGVDVSDEKAVEAALKLSVPLRKEVDDILEKYATTLPQKAGRAAAAGAIETTGEGVGEYSGQAAATGKGDLHEAIIESVAGAGTSAAQAAIAGTYEGSKLGLKKLTEKNQRQAGPDLEIEPLEEEAEPPDAGDGGGPTPLPNFQLKLEPQQPAPFGLTVIDPETPVKPDEWIGSVTTGGEPPDAGDGGGPTPLPNFQLKLEPKPQPAPFGLTVINPETGERRLANQLDQELAEALRKQIAAEDQARAKGLSFEAAEQAAAQEKQADEAQPFYPEADYAEHQVAGPDGGLRTAMAEALTKAGVPVPTPAAVDSAAHTAATSPLNDLPEPTEAQKKAGNYKKGHINIQGLDISIENPRGSVRRGTNKAGKPWATTMRAHYGYIRREAEGADGDPVDVFVGARPESNQVFVVDQVDPETGGFDEHKVMIGYPDAKAAKRGYLANYQQGWKGFGRMTPMSMDQFKGWLRNEDTTAPAAEAVPQGEIAPEATKPAEPVVAAAVAPNFVLGKQGQSYTPSGAGVAVQYAVVEADSLVTSHDEAGAVNPAYPADLQPRDRSRDASALQIQQISENLNPALLGENASITDGAPIVGQDGVVESGNGRIEGVRRAYRTGAGERYRNYLFDAAGKFGLKKGQIKDMRQPVLVRIRRSDVDRAAFAREANQRTTLAFSPAESARADAERLTDKHMELFEPSADGDMTAASNRPFVTAFLQSLGPQEAAGLMTKDNTPTPALITRIKSAIFRKVYDSDTLLALQAEDTNPQIRGVLNALTAAAPTFAKAQALDPEMGGYGVTGYISRAAEIIKDAKNKGLEVTELLAQGDAFTQTDPITSHFVRLMDMNRRTPGQLATALKGIAAAIEREVKRNQSQDIFGDQPATLAAILGMSQPAPVSTSVSQPSNQDPEALIKNPVSGTATEKLEQIHALQVVNQPILETFIAGLVKAIPGTTAKTSIKKDEVILEKSKRPSILKGKPWHDVEHVRDTLRFKAVYTNLADLPKIADYFIKNFPGGAAAVVKIDTNKLFSPKEWGFRFIGLDLRMPNGHLVEWYMPIREIEDIKDQNHLLFEKWRDKDVSKLSGQDLQSYYRDVQVSYNSYNGAWEAALQRQGLTGEADARAFLNQFSATLGSETKEKSSAISLAEGTAEPSSALTPSTKTPETPGASLSRTKTLAPSFDSSTTGFISQSSDEIIAERQDLSTIIQAKEQENELPARELPETGDRLPDREAGAASDRGRGPLAGGLAEADPTAGEGGPADSLPGGAHGRGDRGDRLQVQPSGIESDDQRGPGDVQPPPGAAGGSPAESVLDPTAAPGYGESNTITSKESYLAAVAHLKSSLYRLNANPMDPQLLASSITVASYHIEAGAREFGAFSKAMIKDLGAAIKPYLRSIYEQFRHHPAMKEYAKDMSPIDDLFGGPENEPITDNVKTPAISNKDLTIKQLGDVGSQVQYRSGFNEEIMTISDIDEDGHIQTDRGGPYYSPTEFMPAKKPKPEAPIQSPSVSGPAPVDHVITDDKTLGAGSAWAKVRGNIQAIRILKQIETDGRHPTADERAALSHYVGWGGLKQIFDPNNPKYAKEREELRKILTADEYAAARRSQLDAHYTSAEVVHGMWAAAQRLGFTGGRVLESSMGTGNFFGLMPSEIRGKSGLFGVELDITTGKIAQVLYPSASIIAGKGYQDVSLPSNSFDFAIGNPPFGEQTLFDPDHKAFKRFSIHGFFFAKNLDKLRPGGIMEMVVSRYLLDSSDANAVSLRKYLAKHARLLGAYRLPDTAFKATAGTEVITDVIYLQKLEKGETADDSWTGLHEVQGKNKDGESFPFSISTWYQQHPDMILGTQTATGKMYGGNQYNVTESTAGLGIDIRRAIQLLPENVYQDGNLEVDDLSNPDVLMPLDVPVYGYFIDADGRVSQRNEDALGKRSARIVEYKDSRSPLRMAGMIQIRDVMQKLIRKELDEAATDAELDALRDDLNKKYDAFKKEFGYLNTPVNMRLFVDDPGWPRVSALESGYDPGVSEAKAKADDAKPRAASAKKAAIFTTRGRWPAVKVTSAESAADALAASLNEYGEVRPDFMADIYQKPWLQIRAELGQRIFNDPELGWVEADAYLSGNVKRKAEQAQAAYLQSKDEEYAANVEALRAVFPKDKTYREIGIRLGAYWLPGDVMQQFMMDKFGTGDARALYVKPASRWSISGGYSQTAKATYGTKRMDPVDIFTHVVNNKAIIVKDNVGSSINPQWVVNESETELANARADEIKKEFDTWVWQDEARRTRLTQLFNDNYNTDRPRAYDGSHLTFPGLAPGMELRPHIKNAVWRAIQDRRILLDHVVGAGKTPALAATLMEMRRIGMVRKPMIAVPPALVAQWRDEIAKFYPGANVLMATEKDFEKANRQKLFGRIATGDWDMIVVAHTAFGKIPVPAEIHREIVKEQMDEILAAIQQLKEEKGDRHIVRDMERMRDRLQEKLRELDAKSGEKDAGADFSELGIDALAVDEAHLYKNLFYMTKMQRVAGLGTAKGSGRAFDMFIKTRYLAKRYKGRAPLIFATGTPISNTLVEMFTMQRYMQWEALKEQNLHLLDTWASIYGDVQNVYEVHPSGTGYRMASRFAKFNNLSSLMSMYKSFADIITMSKLKQDALDRGDTFPVPKIKGGRPENIVAERSPEQTRFFGTPEFARDHEGKIVFELERGAYGVVEEGGKFFYQLRDTPTAAKKGPFDTREEAQAEISAKETTPVTRWNEGSILWMFENLARLTKESEGKINALSITNKARKAGLDYRLIDPGAADFAGSKVNLAIDNILRIYKKWDADKGAQLVFSDLSTPKSERKRAAVKVRKAYVRKEDGDLRRVDATYTSVEGAETAFLLAKGKRAPIEVYDGVSGGFMGISAVDRLDAKRQLKDLFASEAGQQRLLEVRDQYDDITDEEIRDFRDQNDIEEVEEEGGEITLGDITSMQHDDAFSVYDDIKAKLIARGIPEKEIAFIHDAPTALQKQALVKRVNKGEIRILLGSTPKMGAGMNAQARLVALHHLDAPWKPSDLEQREGRIVRQGNELYKRDPENFEVEILRYGTRQTYDTRMWQLIEHKASGIEQLREHHASMTEFEEDIGEAANAADMKAAASGNPLILEEIQLRNQVKSLEAQQRGHQDAQYDIQAKLRYAQEAPQRYEKERAAIQPIIDHAKTHPIPKEGEPLLTLNGKVYAEHKAIRDPLYALFAKKTQSIDDTADSAGTYRGVKLAMLRRSDGSIEVRGLLPGDTRSKLIASYAMNDQFSATGLLQRVNNYLSGAVDHLQFITETRDAYLAKAEEYKTLVNKPWEKEAELSAVRNQHRGIVSKLRRAGGAIQLPPEMQAELEAAIRGQSGEGAAGPDLDIAPPRHQGFFSLGDTTTDFTKARAENVIGKASTFLSDSLGLQINIIESDNIPTSVKAQVPAGKHPKGFHYQGQVYIVADALENARDAQLTFAHEVIGHAGMEAIMGETRWQALQKRFEMLKQSANKDVQAILKETHRRNPGVATDAVLEMKEFIAIAAEQREAQGPVARFLSHVVEMLRKALRAIGLQRPFSLNDIHALLRQSTRHLRGQQANVDGILGTAGADVGTPATVTTFSTSQESTVFYSQLLKTVQEATQAKATPEQWNALFKKSGVKQEELDWLDVAGFFEGKKAITKDELAEFVAMNQVEVKEVVKGPIKSKRDLEVIRNRDGSFSVVDADGGVRLDGVSERQADDFVDQQWNGEETKFSQYQLPGGANYKELLLTLPSRPWSEVQAGKNTAIFAEYDPLIRAAAKRGDQAEAQRLSDERDAKAETEAPRDIEYKSSHFDEPNILAHIRFNERTDADGGRVLFIEEVQSDWHQKGRKEGYTPEQTHPAGWASTGDARSTGRGVPDAPFKTTWPTLAIKRMLRYAAENGFDSVAWTTGTQQADRYELSKQVDSIGYYKRGGLYNVKVWGKHDDIVYKNESASKEDIENTLGKEILAKMEKGEGRVAFPSGTQGITYLTGVDLKVGGEGMKAFYDEMLPNIVNKYVKKWSGKVRSTTISQGTGEWYLFEGNRKLAGPFGTKSEAVEANGDLYAGEAEVNQERDAVGGGDDLTVHAINITPPMRESVMQGQPLFAVAPQTDSSDFKKWFGDSVVTVDSKPGSDPLIVYHGTADDVEYFNLDHPNRKDTGWLGEGVYLTSSQSLANSYASLKSGASPNVMPLYASLKNPYFATIKDKQRLQLISHGKGKEAGLNAAQEWTKSLQEKGYDGVILKYGKEDVGAALESSEIVVFDPAMVKSATGNRGAFDPKNPNILFSLEERDPPYVQRLKQQQTSSTRSAPTGQGAKPQPHKANSVLESAMNKAGLGEDTRSLSEKIVDIVKTANDAINHDLKLRMEEGVFNKFLGIDLAEKRVAGNLPAEQSGYVAARLSSGLPSVMRGILEYGAPEWRDGIISRTPKSKGLLEILQPAKDDLGGFFGWMIGRRAARLIKEGRERNFTQAEINALLALNKGKEKLYQQVADDYDAFKKKVLDVAERAGLIDKTTRSTWDLADYIPFYRLNDADETKGPGKLRGLSHQSFGKRLHGGTSALGDPLENIVMNFAHLLDASMKNHALDLTIENLDGDTVLEKISSIEYTKALVPLAQIKTLLKSSGMTKADIDAMPADALEGMRKLWSVQPPSSPDVIRVMRKGKAEYYRVHDPMLLRALTAINQEAFKGLTMTLGRGAKRLLTGAVTAEPTFILRNWIRDSLHAWIINPDKFKLGIDSLRGAAKTLNTTGGTLDMMFSGASFLGGYLNSTDPQAVANAMRRALSIKGYTKARQDSYVQSLLLTGEKLWTLYRQAGDAAENANREAVYEAGEKAGKSRAQRVFEAKDLMDFSLQGNFAIVRLMGDLLPFVNARMQGMYKLGRTGALPGFGLRKHVIVRGGLLMLASLALYAMNQGRDEYDELEDWDKDLNWHFWILGQHYRLPKPFEVGLLFGTIPERFAALMLGNDDPEKTFERLLWAITDTMAFNPLPQLIRPAAEVYFNWDMFTRRPIEGMGDEGKIKSARFNQNTSDTMRFLGKFTEGLNLSPKQLEHLWQGYFGTLGTYLLGTADLAVRAIEGRPPRPTRRIDEYPVIKAFVREAPAFSTQYQNDLYEMRQEVEQIYRTINAYRDLGLDVQADKLEDKHGAKLDERQQLNRAADDLGDIRKELDQIYLDESMSPDEKRREVDRLLNERAVIAKDSVKGARPAF